MPHDAHGLILVRGAGDLASGVLASLYRAGYAVGALECSRPSAIRRRVSFAEAVYEGRCRVEEIEALRVHDVEEFRALALGRAAIPLLVDPEAVSRAKLRPRALVDAIMAKRCLGTNSAWAPLVLALGPGFEAGRDAHAVVETQRGHDLARLYRQGRAAPDTGQPGDVVGVSDRRVVRAEQSGVVRPLQEIGDIIRSGQPIASIINNNTSFTLYAKIDGVLRGIIRPGFQASAGLKIADIDPRGVSAHCFTISDKARSIGGSVLEALLSAGIVP